MKESSRLALIISGLIYLFLSFSSINEENFLQCRIRSKTMGCKYKQFDFTSYILQRARELGFIEE